MKNFLATLITSTFLLTASGYAQNINGQAREVGLRTNGFNDLGMIYKKQIGENMYRRYRGAFGNLGATFQDRNRFFNVSIGGAYGKEKRKDLTEKLQGVYGAELLANVSLTSVSGSSTFNGDPYTTVSPSVGVGLVLGAQYNFSPKWYVSTELTPALTVNGVFAGGTAVYGVNLGFTSSSVGITGAYRF